MKKYLIASLLLFSLCLGLGFKTDNKPPEPRVYTFTLPEDKVNPFFTILTGRTDAVSMKDATEILGSLNNQAQTQSKEFARLDSIDAARKKDSVPGKKKP